MMTLEKFEEASEIVQGLFIAADISLYTVEDPEDFKELLENEETYNIYENRFLHTLVNTMERFVLEREDELKELEIKVGKIDVKLDTLLNILNEELKIFRNKLSKKDMLCNISIIFEESKVDVNAIIDTGNFLKEPLTGKPVIIVEKDVLTNTIPANPKLVGIEVYCVICNGIHE